MSLYIILALLNGVCIALSRILNGQLCQTKSAFSASTVNHFVGFGFLSVLIMIFTIPVDSLPPQPILYTGGIIGALYVAINSYIMTRLGSTDAMIMVIAGQMLFGVLMEFFTDDLRNLPLQLSGVGLIIVGIWLKGNVERLYR